MRRLDYSDTGSALLLHDLVAERLHTGPMHFRTEMMLRVIAVKKPGPIVKFLVTAHAPGKRFVRVATIVAVVAVQVGKAMVLTPRAAGLRRPVREVLPQIQAITHDSPEFDPATSDRKIVVETSDYVISVFLGEVLRRASIHAPLMKFRVRTAATLGLMHLENADIDLLTTPDFQAGPGYPAEPIFEDSWSCLAWAENDRIGDVLTLAQYLELGHVICGVRPHRLSRVATTVCQSGGERRLKPKHEVMDVCFNQTSQVVRYLHPVYPPSHAHIKETRMEAPKQFEVDLCGFRQHPLARTQFAQHRLENSLPQQADIALVERWVIERGEHEQPDPVVT